MLVNNVVEYGDLISYDIKTGLISFNSEKHRFSLGIVSFVYIYDNHLFIDVRFPKRAKVFKCKLPKDMSREELVILDDVLCDINEYIKSDGLNEYHMKCSDIFKEYNLCGERFDAVDTTMLFLLIALLALLVGMVVW